MGRYHSCKYRSRTPATPLASIDSCTQQTFTWPLGQVLGGSRIDAVSTSVVMLLLKHL